MGRRREGERGATLVEFALILPVFMALILGMFTGGLAYNRKISITNAVREGVRFGASLDDAAGWGSTVVTRTVDVSGGELTSAQVCAKLVKVDVSGTTVTQTVVQSSPATCPFGGEPSVPSGVEDDDCLAKVWARRPAKLEAMFFSITLNLQSGAVNRWERGDCGS